MSDKIPFLVCFTGKDGKSYERPVDERPFAHRIELDYANIAQRGLKESGHTIPFGEKEYRVNVVVYRLEIVEARIVRKLVYTRDIPIPVAPMTTEQYENEMMKVLSMVNTHFHHFIREIVYDRYSNESNETRLQYTRSLVDEIIPCVNEIIKDIRRSTNA